MNKKLLLGGGVLAALLLMGGGKKSKGKATPSDGLGDLGDMAGPKGCKPGLEIDEEGKCDLPEDLEDVESKSKGQGKGGSKWGIIIYGTGEACTYEFTDKTGNKFWKDWASKSAKQWVEYGEDNPLEIAYQMLKQLSSCFADYPVKKDFENFFEYEQALKEWIDTHRDMWELMILIRNRIDLEFFGGQTTIEAEIQNGQINFGFGPGFDYVAFEGSIKPTLYTILAMETENPGSSYIGADKNDASTHVNTTVYMFTRLFPYLKLHKLNTDLVYKYNIGNSEFFEWLVGDPLDSIENQALDIEFP